MKSYKDLTVWQKSLELCVEIYKITRSFPRDELYGITSQIRRCCIAIPSNIAEGQKRGHLNEFIQFLRIAYGSGAELETQLLIAYRIGYLTKQDYDRLYDMLQEVMRMLNRLLNSLTKTKA